MNNLVSVIIPVYNRSNIVIQTLNSILNQSYVNWECILVDDFSTDETYQVLLKYQTKDRRFRVVKNYRKKGAQGARNSGFLLAKGDFIVFFDSDNLMSQDYLKLKLFEFDKNKELDIVTSFSRVLNNANNTISTFCWITKGDIYIKLLQNIVYVDTNSSMLKRNKIEDIGLLDEDCPSYQELDMHLRLSKNCKYSFIPEFLTQYYKRESNTISSNIELDIKGQLYILSKYRYDFIKLLGKKYFFRKQFSVLISAKKNNISLEGYSCFNNGIKIKLGLRILYYATLDYIKQIINVIRIY